MPDKKISALTAVTTPLGTDEFAVNQGGTSKKETLTQIGAAIFLFDDVVWQNATDSLTGFQILDNDGGVPIFNVDTINERIGIRTASPDKALDIDSGGIVVASGGAFGAATGLSFGDGDTEIRESADDALEIAIEGVSRWTITLDIKSANASRAGIIGSSNSSATNPTLLPRMGNIDTGLGSSGDGVLNLISDALTFLQVGGSQTAFIQDPTSVTGDTLFILKEGAVTSLNLFEAQSNSGVLGVIFPNYKSVRVDAAGTFGLLSGYGFGDGDMEIYEIADDDLHIWGGDVSIIDPNDLASESLTDPTDFTDDADWDFTGEVTDSSTNAVFTFSSTGAGTITQTNGAMAIVGVNSRWYKAVYVVSSSTVADAVMTITSAFALAAVTLSTADGTHTVYFKSAVAADVADFVIDITGATAGAFTLESITVKEVTGGDLLVNGDINTVSWRDYGVDSTIGGFSSVTTKNIWYKKVGNLVFITYYILGVSNANTFTFTVPYTSVNSTNARNYTAAQVQNNSVTLLPPGMCLMELNSKTATVFIDFGGTVWVTSNNKHARGQFVYEAQ